MNLLKYKIIGGSHTVRDFQIVSIILLNCMLNRMQTVSALDSFFLAMLLYPDVQAKAQEEIDRVVGRDRLPTAEDEESLPYVCALVKEVWR